LCNLDSPDYRSFGLSVATPLYSWAPRRREVRPCIGLMKLGCIEVGSRRVEGQATGWTSCAPETSAPSTPFVDPSRAYFPSTSCQLFLQALASLVLAFSFDPDLTLAGRRLRGSLGDSSDFSALVVFVKMIAYFLRCSSSWWRRPSPLRPRLSRISFPRAASSSSRARCLE